jgi:hypothetical protein
MENQQIRSIFFSEFHPTAGPKIVFQVPEDIISAEEFDLMHVYVIPKKQLRGRTISLNFGGHRILGCPVYIEGPQYARNALIFNCCFVFDSLADSSKFEKIVRKLSNYLTTLEMQHGFLSNEKKHEKLPGIMQSILNDLNKFGICEIYIDKSTSLHLQREESVRDLLEMNDYDVPIMINKPGEGYDQLDVAARQVIRFIDGRRYVIVIAKDADMDLKIVKLVIHSLIQHKICALIPIFQYSNVYMTTPLLAKLIQDKNLQEQCLKFVAMRELRPCIRDILQMYCSMVFGTTMRDLCVRVSPRISGVHEERLIQFGLIYGLIRRLHRYPVRLPDLPQRQYRMSEATQAYNTAFCGRYCDDHVCSRSGSRFGDLDSALESDPQIMTCWK